MDNPEVATVAWSVGGGLFGSAWVALSRPMNRREVLFCLIGGVGTAAFIPPAACQYWGLQPAIGGAIGFAAGVSVFAVFAGLQSLTGLVFKRAEDKIKGQSPGGEQP